MPADGLRTSDINVDNCFHASERAWYFRPNCIALRPRKGLVLLTEPMSRRSNWTELCYGLYASGRAWYFRRDDGVELSLREGFVLSMDGSVGRSMPAEGLCTYDRRSAMLSTPAKGLYTFDGCARISAPRSLCQRRGLVLPTTRVDGGRFLTPAKGLYTFDSTPWRIDAFEEALYLRHQQSSQSPRRGLVPSTIRVLCYDAHEGAWYFRLPGLMEADS